MGLGICERLESFWKDFLILVSLNLRDLEGRMGDRLPFPWRVVGVTLFSLGSESICTGLASRGSERMEWKPELLVSGSGDGGEEI